MSRRYSKELALESGTPLGIAPRSDYSVFVKRDASSGRIIEQDMRVVGNDIRRSANTVYRKYIVRNGERLEAPDGKVFVVEQRGIRLDASGKQANTKGFDKYAQLYRATKR